MTDTLDLSRIARLALAAFAAAALALTLGFAAPADSGPLGISSAFAQDDEDAEGEDGDDAEADEDAEAADDADAEDTDEGTAPEGGVETGAGGLVEAETSTLPLAALIAGLSLTAAGGLALRARRTA